MNAKWTILIVCLTSLGATAQLGCNGCSGGTLTGTGGAGATGVIHTGAAGAVGSAGITGDTGTAGNVGGAGGFTSTGSGGRPFDCAVPQATVGALASGPPEAMGLLAPIVYPGVAFDNGVRLGVAVGDTTGDGEPDLITVDTTVIVRANDGDGQFGDPFDASYALGPDSSASAVAAGDFNGDRYADVVYLHSGSAYPDVYAAVLLNNHGLLELAEDARVGTGNGQVTTLDVDGDGDLDIVVFSQYGDQPADLAVLLNDGGSFRIPVHTSTGPGEFTMTAGDLDADGLPDLVLGDTITGSVRLFVNLGGGRFASGNAFPAGPFPRPIGVGDVDGDGKPDIAIANDVDPVGDVTNLAGMRSTVSMLRNLGNGVFAAAATYQVGVDVRGGVLQDLNGDGALDVAVVDGNDVDAAVLYNNGDGTFATGVRLAVGGIPQEMTSADLNRDGRADLIVANQGGDTAIVLSRGARQLAVGTNYPTGAVDPKLSIYTRPPAAIAIGDLTGDGEPDLLVSPTLPGNTGMRMLPNLGAGTFGAATVVNVATSASPRALAIADMDGDGNLDVVNGDYYPCVTLNGGAGTFVPPRCYTGVDSGTTFILAIGDVNQDGRLDVVAARDHSIRILTNQGSGVLADFAYMQDATWSIDDAKLADLNGDGLAELVLANGGTVGATGNVVVLRNVGGGNFRPWGSFTAGSSPVAVAVADFDGDRWNDIAVANGNNPTCSGPQGTIDVLRSRGDGTFDPPVRYGGGGYAALAAVDIDDDSSVDLVALEQIDTNPVQMSSLKVLLNDGRGYFDRALQYATGGTASAMAVGNLDGDSRRDFAVASSRGTVSVLLNGRR